MFYREIRKILLALSSISHFNWSSAKIISSIDGCTVKKIRRFYGKIPGNQLPVHFPLFLRASACRTFLKLKYGRVMLTDNIRRYPCMV